MPEEVHSSVGTRQSPSLTPDELPPSYEVVVETDDTNFEISSDSEGEGEEIPFISRPTITNTGFGTRRVPNLPSWMLEHHDFGRPASATRSRRESDAEQQRGSSDHGTPRNSEEQELHREMEFFEVLDPENPSVSLPHTMYVRASQVSKRFAQKISSSLIIPVQQMIVDPVAKFWTHLNARIDAGLGRLGNPLMLRRLAYLIIVSATVFGAIALGIVPTDSGFGNGDGLFGHGRFHDHRKVRTYIKDAISAESLRDTMEYMTSMAHMAGTSGDYILGEHVENLLNSYGIGPVEFNTEHVYLTSSNSTDSAMELKLIDSNGNVQHEAKLYESQALDHPTESQTQPRPFHALAASGSGTGHIIYANYGTKEDFKFLSEKGVDIKGSIVFMKMGRMALGLKVKLAEQAGAVGVVTFSEKLQKDTKLWPDGPDYSADAVERDSVGISAIYPGDILTPGWSSSRTPQVIEYKEARNVPKIPSIPVSWNSAEPFLNALKGHGIHVPDWGNNGQPAGVQEWWTGDKSAPTVFLKNEPIIGERHEIWNVLARIEGLEQYDKAVIIGAQRDAYCYGSVDPMSGTAILLEVARIFSTLYTQLGWTPLRPIYFVSWDGSEHNIAGSTEWVEAHSEDLKKDGLVYIHLDSAVSGNNLNVMGHPLFDGIVNSILKDISDPIVNTTSVADSYGDSHIKTIKDIGDYLPFLSHTGVPAITMRFENRESTFPKHSCYDSLEWMKKFGDPDFRYHKALTEIVSFLVLRFADEPVIPFNVAAYGDQLHGYIRDLEIYARASPGWSENGHKMDFNKLVHASDTMIQGGVYFNEWFNEWLNIVPVGESPMMTGHRWGWNNRLLELDKHLLERNGLPGRNWFKHVIFGPQLWHPTTGDYEWSTFPGIRDAIEAGDWETAVQEVEHVAEMISFACNRFVQ
ncbi:Tre1p [Sugiyamaella lignohabitans]|uniref:Tre1p n=1 Tax=Sugiyamaella lignohabitans TaxID=796027 RepID=A0A167E050_9ASCO|nr:Tre1p [Sugiyamaella lignohabitans]ANB13493.1 Tre1p [Sugiyamaella lignohabitans]